MICTVKQINILDMLDMYGEDSCKEILSTFICPLNIDVSDFRQISYIHATNCTVRKELF